MGPVISIGETSAEEILKGGDSVVITVNNEMLSFTPQRDGASMRILPRTSIGRLSNRFRFDAAKCKADGTAIGERFASKARGRSAPRRKINWCLSFSQNLLECAVHGRSGLNTKAIWQTLNQEACTPIPEEKRGRAAPAVFWRPGYLRGWFESVMIQRIDNFLRVCAIPIGNSPTSHRFGLSRTASFRTSVTNTADSFSNRVTSGIEGKDTNAAERARAGGKAPNIGSLFTHAAADAYEALGAPALHGNHAIGFGGTVTAIPGNSFTEHGTVGAFGASSEGRYLFYPKPISKEDALKPALASNQTSRNLTEFLAATARTLGVAGISFSNRVASKKDSVARGGAVEMLMAMPADLGMAENRFENFIEVAGVQNENLSAARSRIQDADFAAETANLTRAQILQQAGLASLAQANASPQAVPSAFG
jgi:flagellin